MTIDIPSGVFSAYEDMADAMITHFGVPCQLLYTDKVEVVSQTLDTVKQRRTMSLSNQGGDYSRGSVTYKNVDVVENITLRVYYTKKEWQKIGSFDLADGSIVCIGYLSDLPKLNKAHTLVVSTDVGLEDWRFQKAGEPFPWGFKKRRYLASTWKRV